MDEVKIKLEHIMEDVDAIKKALIRAETLDKKKTEAAWKDLTEASAEISKRWKGPSAVNEIKAQRTKSS